MNKNKGRTKDYLFINLICCIVWGVFLLLVYAGKRTALPHQHNGTWIGMSHFTDLIYGSSIHVYFTRQNWYYYRNCTAVIECCLGTCSGLSLWCQLYPRARSRNGLHDEEIRRYYYGTTMLAVITTIFTFLWTGFRKALFSIRLEAGCRYFVIRLVTLAQEYLK